MALVKSDRPVGGLPCTDQDRLLSCWAEVLEQPRADAGTLIFGYDIGVADQIHSASVLHTHHTDQAAVGATGARHDTVSHLRCECFGDGRSEEHTSELQSLIRNPYAVFCLK